MPTMGTASALLIVVVFMTVISCEGIGIQLESSLLSTNASSSSSSPSVELKARFESFLASHGRNYSPTEQEGRFAIWLDNLAVVETLNGRGMGATFSADGPFGDMTPHEFSTKVLMAPQAAPRHPAKRYMQAPSQDSSVPEEKDWRKDGAVTPVKDQGSLGSCWAFSAIENLEGQLFLSNGALTPLSVEQLVECDNGTDQKHDKGDCGEFGGWPYIAYEYLIGAGGIHSDETFPYCSGIPYGDEGNCMPCMAPGYDKQECGDHSDLYCDVTTTKGQVPGGLCEDMSDAVAQVADWKAVGPDEGEIKEQLAAVGPLSVAINAALLQFYWYGIYDPYDYFCDPEALDHAVLLVGYGAEDGKDFWTVKNSWGTSWGEDGYFRIVRGQGKCGINTAVTTGFLASAANKTGGRQKPSTPPLTMI